jgi:hypothetical protein
MFILWPVIHNIFSSACHIWSKRVYNLKTRTELVLNIEYPRAVYKVKKLRKLVGIALRNIPINKTSRMTVSPCTCTTEWET